MFIAVEGIDGSGKTTKVREVSEKLIGMGKKVQIIKEPSGTIRQLLISGGFNDRAKLMLYLASILQNQPAHPEISLSGVTKTLYIGERCIVSSLAYQIMMEGVMTLQGFLSMINELEVRWPSVIYYLNLPPACALLRVKDRGADNPGGYDDMPFDEFERLHKAYHTIRDILRYVKPDVKWVELDATLDPPILTDLLLTNILSLGDRSIVP